MSERPCTCGHDYVEHFGGGRCFAPSCACALWRAAPPAPESPRQAGDRRGEGQEETRDRALLIALTRAVDILATVPAGDPDEKLIWDREVGPAHAAAQDYLLSIARAAYTGAAQEETRPNGYTPFDRIDQIRQEEARPSGGAICGRCFGVYPAGYGHECAPPAPAAALPEEVERALHGLRDAIRGSTGTLRRLDELEIALRAALARARRTRP